MNRFTYLLKKWTCKRTCLVHDIVDGHDMTIVDEHYPLHLFPDMRIMKGKNGWFSAIYKDVKRIDQPMYPEIQSAVETWIQKHHSNNFVVLGCAGCSLLRFVCMKYPHAQVLGVEKSQTMIDLAKKYFFDGLDNNKVELIHDDAFDYLEQQYNNIDVCIVDLFDGCNIVEGIYEESFIRNLAKATRTPSIVLFNFFGQSVEKGNKICQIAKRYFDHTHLYSIDDGYLPVFIKGDCLSMSPDLFSDK